MSDLTILATTGSDGVRAAIEGWTAAGLLRRSVWLDQQALDTLPAHLMGMQVHLVDRDGSRPSELREVFGDEPYRVVRVLAVRQVRADGVPDDLTDRLWAFAERLADAVGDASLVRLNVVVPGQAPVTAKGLLEPGWDVNVVVSPEDRPREGAVDHGFDGPEEFDAHTALAATTVGALWDRTRCGPFDEQQGQATGKRGAIAVVRSAARVLDARGLPAGIVVLVLGDGATSLARFLPGELQRVADDEALINEMFETFLPVENKILFYHDRRPPVLPTPRILRMTLRMLPRFWAQLTRLKVEQVTRAGFARLDAEAEEWLQRFMGGAFFRPSPEEMIDCADDAPASLRPNPLLPRTAPPYEFVWPALRQLCFGLVDGGALPAKIRERTQGLQPRVGDPRWVAPSPDDGFALPAAVRQLLEEAGQPGHGVRAGDHNSTDRLAGRLELARAFVAGRVTGDEAQQAADLAAIDDCSQELSRWRLDRKWERSLVGRLAGHLSEEIRTAREALQRRKRDYEQENKDRNAILLKLDQVHDQMWWFLSLVLGLVAVSVGWLSLSVGSRLALAFWLPLFLAVGVGGWVLWLAARAAALETSLLEVEARRRSTVAAVKEWPSEAVRLASLYWILLDWGEIVGWLLHRPFGPQELTVTPEAGAEAPRPEAFRLGASEVSEERVHDLAKLAVKDAFTDGWVGRLYAAVIEATFPDLGEVGVRDAENDPDKSPAPPRSRLAADAAAAGLAPGTGPDAGSGGAGGAGVDAGGAGATGVAGAGGAGAGGAGADDDGAGTDGDDEPPQQHARERLLQSFRSPGGAGVIAMRHATAATRAALLRLPAGALLSRMTVAEPAADASVAAEAFLLGAMPSPAAGAPCLALAPTLFSDLGKVNGRTTVARVHLWGTSDQPVVEDLTVPDHEQILREDDRSAGGDRELARFSLIRLDVSDCEESDLAFPL
jgi:hypothetical protein